MSLHNYDKDTFIINLGTKIQVIKRHYPIDFGDMQYKTDRSRLFYMDNQNILHICDTRVEAHSLEVQKNSVKITSFDCI
mgnify:CR=1 FL=1